MFIDTNVLVGARFTVAPQHGLARARLRDAVGSAEFDQNDFHRYRDRIEPVDPTANA